MSTLADQVESLKRAVAVAGTFASLYPDTTDDDLTSALADGFAEAQLDGFFTTAYGGVTYTLNPATATVTPDVTAAQGALVVIYSAATFVQAQLLNLKNRQKFAARGADFETEQSATILTTLLKQFTGRKAMLSQRAQISGAGAAFSMADGYFLAATQHYYFNGSAYDVGGGSGYAYSDVDPNGW